MQPAWPNRTTRVTIRNHPWHRKTTTPEIANMDDENFDSWKSAIGASSTILCFSQADQTRWIRHPSDSFVAATAHNSQFQVHAHIIAHGNFTGISWHISADRTVLAANTCGFERGAVFCSCLGLLVTVLRHDERDEELQIRWVVSSGDTLSFPVCLHPDSQSLERWQLLLQI